MQSYFCAAWRAIKKLMSIELVPFCAGKVTMRSSNPNIVLRILRISHLVHATTYKLFARRGFNPILKLKSAD